MCVFLEIMPGVFELQYFGLGEISQPEAFQVLSVNAGSFIPKAMNTGLSLRATKLSCTVARKSLTRPAGPDGISRGKTRMAVRDDHVGCGAR